MRDICVPVYKEPMQPHKNNDGFTQRLTSCVERVGGKRAMANAALISEAQLFRYLNAESNVPSDRLVAIAKAAQVDAGWLLTGKDGGKEAGDAKPPFRTELMVQVIQTFEELLVESDKSFTPRQRALAMTLIYESLRFEEKRKEHEVVIDKRLAPFYPDYLAPLRSDHRMEDYHKAMNALEDELQVSIQSLKQFDTLIKMGVLGIYDGAAGEIYFEKLGTQLLPEAAKLLISQVEECQKLVGKHDLDWLDAGCGNGRHLAFLNQHMPNLKLKGFEGSQQGINLSSQLIRAGKLPEGSIETADFRNLPYMNESMDVVYCRLGLQLLPYIAGHHVGAMAFLHEIHRVLRPGGLAVMLTYAGHGRDYIPFVQYHSPDSITAMAHEAGLNVVRMAPAAVNETGGSSGQDYSIKLDSGLQVILQKE